MASARSSSMAVGAMFILGLLIIAVTIMAVGQDSRLFSQKSKFRVVFPTTDGLMVGSPVKIAGVQVGTVLAVRLPTDPSQSGIEVEVGVDVLYSERIREDSTAALRILQLLTGEKFVEILAGSAEVPPMADGSAIPSSQDPEILAQAAVAAENLNDITISLKTILESLESGEGLIGQMITDPEFGREGLEALYGTVSNLQRLTTDMTEGRGFISRLLYDEGVSQSLDDMGTAMQDFAVLMASANQEDGTVATLLQEGGAGQQTIENLQKATESLEVILGRLEAGRGFLGQLLASSDYEGDMAMDFGRILSNLAEITDKINRGEGTLGLLVNDRVVHDGMEEVVAGVGNSKYANWLLRHYQKKGIKLEEQQIENQE
jgi:phospholipid/cholesterol/gamma-HCH transport system substrate-binding protein